MDKFIYYSRLFLFVAFAIFLLVAYGYSDAYRIMIALVSLFILIVVEVLPRKTSFKIPAIYVTVIYILLFLGMLLGDLINIYETNLIYDKILHIITGFILVMLGLSIVYNRNTDKYVNQNIIKVFIYAFFFMLLIESIWEAIEMSSDLAFGTNMTQGGLVDTKVDYYMDLIGGAIALILSYIHIKIKNITIVDLFVKAFRN
jgi:uncharacterized membrane protein YjdF